MCLYAFFFREFFFFHLFFFFLLLFVIIVVVVIVIRIKVCTEIQWNSISLAPLHVHVGIVNHQSQNAVENHQTIGINRQVVCPLFRKGNLNLARGPFDSQQSKGRKAHQRNGAPAPFRDPRIGQENQINIQKGPQVCHVHNRKWGRSDFFHSRDLLHEIRNITIALLHSYRVSMGQTRWCGFVDRKNLVQVVTAHGGGKQRRVIRVFQSCYLIPRQNPGKLIFVVVTVASYEMLGR
mmetsp:Transcript_17810/g.44438  ORF Transcript_17810/g.44438 Transcript_17810/m.44438 type:complete len:236 (+) Transcript_17810:63-770(+)